MSTASDPALGAVQRGAVLCDLGRFHEAARLLGEAVASNPADVRAWCLLAHAEIGQKRYSQGLEAAQQAAAVAPNEEWPHRLMCVAAEALGGHVKALRHAEEAVRLAPHEWRAHAQLAQQLLRMSDVVAAEAPARQTLELAPHEVGANLIAGAVAAAAGRRREAAAAFRRALEIDPDNSVAHHELARLKVRRGLLGSLNSGRLASAVAGFATAVRADPTAEVSRKSMDALMRGFLRLLAYFIFLVAWLSGVVLKSHGATTRNVTIVLLVLPVGYAMRFVAGLPRTLRPYLFRLALTEGRWMATVLELGAVAALIASAFTSAQSRGTLAGVAVAAAIVARLILWALHQTR